jgi:phosphoribosylglycinamide formyltransferase 1
MQTNLAIFCSGSGSNAEKIMEYFQHHPTIQVKLLLANNPEAYALERAKKFDVPVDIFTRDDFYNSLRVAQQLEEHDIDWIILAGFLWLIPEYLIKQYPSKIINIHPALLPKFGGKGMYGMHVHEAVVAAKEKESGITIHYVNTKYDEGAIIFQQACELSPSDDAKEVARKVLTLEHAHYPRVIEETIKKQLV